MVGGVERLFPRVTHGVWQPLPSVDRVRRHAGPTRLTEALVRLLEARRRHHLARLQTAPVHLSDPIERRQNILGEARTLLEDTIDELTRQVAVGVELPIFILDLAELVKDKAHVAQGSAVPLHSGSPSDCPGSPVTLLERRADASRCWASRWR
jgi:hypothetical protein